MNELALFAGAGGGILGGKLHGRRTVCAVERDGYAAQVLAQRQNDGILEAFPIWSDVTTFDGRPWCGIIDVVSGGFPCQDISAAGAGAGIDGERSGLWGHMARIIRDVQPRYVEVENSPILTSRGLGRVLGDLAEMGFDAEWGVVSAADTGAPHLRERIWIVANARSGRCGGAQNWKMEQPWRAETVGRGETVADPDREPGHEWRKGNAEERQGGRDFDRGYIGAEVADTVRECEQRIIAGGTDAQDWKESSQRPDRPRSYGFGRWPVEPGMGRVADGVANRMDRIKALGNGQVPRVEAAAFHVLTRKY